MFLFLFRMAKKGKGKGKGSGKGKGGGGKTGNAIAVVEAQVLRCGGSESQDAACFHSSEFTRAGGVLFTALRQSLDGRLAMGVRKHRKVVCD